MSISRRDEERLLSADERELVAKSHKPAIQALGSGELNDLIRLVRERRTRARQIASKQRREMRGKSAPTSAAPAARNDGTTRKSEALSAALKRLNSEKARREAKDAQPTQAALARKALRKKKAADATINRPSSRTRGRGMKNIENQRTEDLTRPMEVGRVNKFVAVAQAKRDARG
jgi:hypothetical protein